MNKQTDLSSQLPADTAPSPGEPETVKMFLESQCEVDSAARITAPEIFEAYERWAVATGRTPVGQFLFGLEMDRLGHRSEAGGREAEWLGLRLAPSPDSSD